MIDVRMLREDFALLQERLQLRGVPQETLLELKERSLAYKEAKQSLEEKQALMNKKSKLFGQYMKEKKDVGELKAQVESLKNAIAEENKSVSAKEESLYALLPHIPNIPDADTPEGADEADNLLLKTVLAPPSFDFTPKEHWELAAELGWIDFERGVKLAKSRFSVFSGEGARMVRALTNFMLDFNRSRGFEEVATPVIVNEHALYGTGQLPKFENDLFKVDSGDENNLYLIPTAEVTLTNLHADEILKSEELPKRMSAYTPCFRKEAGSGGRDTRGIIRQHQFDKVEIVSIAKPEESDALFEEMVATASAMLGELGLAHRLMRLCGGDMGFSAAKTVDIEVWLPGQNCYREISSISNTRDFQARRAKIRYKEGKKNRLVHTLNGSSLAIGRTLVAIMENYQRSDGTITIPDALKNYL